jgi:hypothetical protein
MQGKKMERIACYGDENGYDIFVFIFLVGFRFEYG